MKKLGKIQHNIDASFEYEMLANGDEKAANSLRENGLYRQAIYFYIQAMEKQVRSKIFTLVSANIPYFREMNRHHSLEKAIEFLLHIISTDEGLKEQIRYQIHERTLGGIEFQKLHNNLRYPFYSHKYDSYSVVEYTKEDCEFIHNGLVSLKNYLSQLNRI